MKIRQTKDKYNIGTNIRKFRMENHMTQEQVVAKMQVLGIGISRSALQYQSTGTACFIKNFSCIYCKFFWGNDFRLEIMNVFVMLILQTCFCLYTLSGFCSQDWELCHTISFLHTITDTSLWFTTLGSKCKWLVSPDKLVPCLGTHTKGRYIFYLPRYLWYLILHYLNG